MPEHEPRPEPIASPSASEDGKESASVPETQVSQDAKERAFYTENMRQIIKAAPKGTDPREHIVTIWRHAAPVFEEAKDEFNEFLDHVWKKEYQNNEELADYAARELQNMRVKTYTVEEFERRLRENAMKHKEFTPLTNNNLLFYNLSKDELELKVHVGPAHAMKPAEMIRSIRDGMKELARQVTMRPELKKVETISGTSWVIEQNPRLVERLGFTVENKPRRRTSSGKVYHRAYMTKEKLLELYSKKEDESKLTTPDSPTTPVQ